jgi:hypothetical protein
MDNTFKIPDSCDNFQCNTNGGGMLNQEQMPYWNQFNMGMQSHPYMMTPPNMVGSQNMGVPNHYMMGSPNMVGFQNNGVPNPCMMGSHNMVQFSNQFNMGMQNNPYMMMGMGPCNMGAPQYAMGMAPTGTIGNVGGNNYSQFPTYVNSNLSRHSQSKADEVAALKSRLQLLEATTNTEPNKKKR